MSTLWSFSFEYSSLSLSLPTKGCDRPLVNRNMVRIRSASYSSASSSMGEEDEVAVSLFLRPNISSSEESESESSSSELLTATTLPSSTTFCVELGRFAKDNGCCDGPGDFTSLIRLCAGEPLYCADRREEKLAT